MIQYLDDLKRILLKYEIPDSDVCLVTSAVFAAKGIRINHDIEFALRPEARKKLLKKYDGGGYNPYSGVVKLGNNIQCVPESYRMFDISDEMLFENEYSEILEGFRIIRLEIYLARKILQNRKKDEQDVCLVKRIGIWTEELDENINRYLTVAGKHGFTLPGRKREEKWKWIFDSNDEICIFGTGYVGRNIYKKASAEKLTDKIKGFLVSERGSSNTLFGKPIYELSEVRKKDVMVLIAVEHCNMVEIKELLCAEGFEKSEEAYMFWE